MHFDSIEALFFIDSGEVIAETVTVNGREFAAGFTGYGGLLEPTVRGQGEITFDDGSEDERVFSFSVSGTWLSPQFEELVQLDNIETAP